MRVVTINKLYNSNEKVNETIQNDTFNYKKLYRISRFLKKHIDNLKFINGLEAKNCKLLDSSTIEYIDINNFWSCCAICQSQLTFKFK